MFKNILNKKSYLIIVTFSIFIGCGGGNNSSSTLLSINNNTINTFGNAAKEELDTYSTIPELSTEYQQIDFSLEANNSTTLLNPSNQQAVQNIQQILLDAINRERAKTVTCGSRGTFGPVAPLTWNSNLHASALEHIMDLAFSKTFSHDGSGTVTDITGNGSPSKFYERIVRNGYNNYYSVGENIAGGQRTVAEVMSAWMASPGHCENIMKSTYTEVGIAVIKIDGSPYIYYWGQNFGSKRN